MRLRHGCHSRFCVPSYVPKSWDPRPLEYISIIYDLSGNSMLKNVLALKRTVGKWPQSIARLLVPPGEPLRVSFHMTVFNALNYGNSEIPEIMHLYIRLHRAPSRVKKRSSIAHNVGIPHVMLLPTYLVDQRTTNGGRAQQNVASQAEASNRWPARTDARVEAMYLVGMFVTIIRLSKPQGLNCRVYS